MRTLEVVDINGDSFDDLLSGIGSGALIVGLGTPQGDITHPVDPETNPDIDDCAPVDIIPALMGPAGLTPFVVCGGNNEVHEWRVLGLSGLAYQEKYAVGSAPTSGDHCDLDGNNYDDIVIVASGEDEVSILMFDANGVMSVSQLAVGTSPQAVRCVDMDQDGDLDIVTVNDGGLGDETITIRLGEGGGNFDLSPIELPLNMANPRDPRDMLIADFNDDGSLDIVIAYAYHNESQQQDPAIGIYLSNP